MSVTRSRGDRCPGAVRPWQAADGMLVRLRLIGGRVSGTSLRALAEVAERYGGGQVHLTSRANLQVRSLPGEQAKLAPEVLAALEETGLLPTRTHELVRNVMVSPQTGLAGGSVDLRPVAAELDGLMCADPALGSLPGRFLFVLDDGRGDLIGRTCDLGLVALDDASVQLRVGAGWGGVVPVGEAAAHLAELAHRFVERRGGRPTAPWHVSELEEPLTAPTEADPGLPAPAAALPFGEVPGGRHVPVSEAGLGRAAVAALTADVEHVIVTPWRGVLVPEEGL
jgi:precorrin-3B synthase